MDKTVREYLELSDSIHTYLDNYSAVIPISQLEEKILELQSSIKILQAVSIKLAEVSNIATILKKKKSGLKNNKVIDPKPTENDHATLRTMFPANVKSITNNISLPVKIVDNINEIPISNIYYVEALKQFAVNINGIIVRGNVGNIIKYTGKNTAICEYGNKCKQLKNKTNCEYYHDPKDYIDNNIPIDEPIIRNFTPGSWFYSSNKNCKTYFTRHVGTLDNLEKDIADLKKLQFLDEVNTREHQLMHDLLIYMILHNKGYLEKYPHWKVF